MTGLDTGPAGHVSSPRILYERRYIEPDIELLVLAPGTRDRPGFHRISRYRPTGIRTSAGYYEYELVEESPVFSGSEEEGQPAQRPASRARPPH